MGYPDEVRAAERAAARKRRNRSGCGGFPLAVRIAQLDRLLTDRYGSILSDDDAGIEDAIIIANHLARCSRDPEARMKDWFMRRTPWMGLLQQAVLIAKIVDNPLKWRAVSLGIRLNLSNEDRDRLRLTTIAPVDVTTEELVAIRRGRRREYAEARRRAGGAVPFAQLRAKALSNTKPWIAMNVSRATWYRLRKVARGETETIA